MKKKLLIVLLCIVTAIGCGIGLAACNLFGDNEHHGEHVHIGEHVAAKSATCAEEGIKEHWYCKGCASYFLDDKCENKVAFSSLKIEKTAHTEVTDKAVPKTCTTSGLTEGKHCSVCKEVIVKQEVIPAGHLEVIDKAVEATCTTDGKTQGKHCTFCNTVTVPQQIIPKGHTLITQEGKEATCTESGLTDGEYCTKCDYKVAQTVISKKGHTEVVDNGKEASCTEDGLTDGKHCSVCSTVLTEQTVIPKKGHTEVVDNGKAPSCTEDGLSDGKHCSVCGTVLVKQEVVPASHKFGSDKLCTECGAHAESGGLEYKLLDYHRDDFTGQGYEVVGIGTCTDSDLYIPATHSGLPVISIDDNAFKDCKTIKNVTVPDGMIYICSAAFDSSSVETIFISKSITSVSYFFRAYLLKDITVDSANPYYKGVDGVLYNKDTTSILCHPIGKKATSFTIPSTVKYISFASFEYNSALRNLVIPASVDSIGSRAFRGCENLSDFTYPTALKTIGGSAFEYCKKLTQANIPDGVKAIGGMAYCSCSAITKISLPDSLISIGHQIFIGTAYYDNDANWEIEYNGNNELRYKALYIGNFLLEVLIDDANEFTVKEGTKSIAVFGIVNLNFNHDLASEEYLREFFIELIIPDSVIYVPEWLFYGYGDNVSIDINSQSQWKAGYDNEDKNPYIFSYEEMIMWIQLRAVRSMIENSIGDNGYIKI